MREQDLRTHWDAAYQRGEENVSWHQAETSLLVDENERREYRRVITDALRPGGHAVIGTFAPDGPASCSGLDVERYSADGLITMLGPSFSLVRGQREEHVTPSGRAQPFTWVVCQRTKGGTS